MIQLFNKCSIPSIKCFPALSVGSRNRFFFQCTIFSYATFRWLVKVMLSNFPQSNLTSSVFVCSLFSVTSTSLMGGCFSDAGGTWVFLHKHNRKWWFNLLVDPEDLWQRSHLFFLHHTDCKINHCECPFLRWLSTVQSVDFQHNIYIYFWRVISFWPIFL